MLEISRLFYYPVKSCAGIETTSLSFDQRGPVHDRQYLIVNDDGRFLTQRQLPKMAFIQPQIDESGLTLSYPQQENIHVPRLDDGQVMTVTVWKDEIQAHDQGDQAAMWLSDVLGRSCRLVAVGEATKRPVNPKYAHNYEEIGFADGFPLLIVNQSSLDVLSQQVGRPLDVLRFRPNVVMSGAEAWQESDWQRLQLNEEQGALTCVKPCERCVIPTRDLLTQEREADVLDCLVRLCKRDGRIIFGQNALTDNIEQLQVDMALELMN